MHHWCPQTVVGVPCIIRIVPRFRHSIVFVDYNSPLGHLCNLVRHDKHQSKQGLTRPQRLEDSVVKRAMCAALQSQVFTPSLIAQIIATQVGGRWRVGGGYPIISIMLAMLFMATRVGNTVGMYLLWQTRVVAVRGLARTLQFQGNSLLMGCINRDTREKWRCTSRKSRQGHMKLVSWIAV